ncbi:MAG TPA: lysylphosphatidylglycerol synthase transmembrane domain-containing protein [Anaerolineae bacterium]
MRRRILFIAPWLLALVLFLWVLYVVPLPETWAVLRRLTLGQVLALLALNALVLLALSSRWWLILRGQGYKIPFLKLAAHRLAAFGVSYLTPGPHFGGEPVQVLLLEREHSVPRPAAVAAVTLDKTLELLVNFTFLVGGVAVILDGRILRQVVQWEAAALAVLLLLLPAAFLLALWLGYHPISWPASLLARLPWLKENSTLQQFQRELWDSEVQATRFCRQAPLSLVQALAVSIVVWLFLIAEYWLMLRLLGVQLTAVQTVAMLMAVRVAILLPLPGALGTLEASQVLTLGLMGLNPAAGIGVSLLIRARDVLQAGTGLWWGGKRLRAGRRYHKMPSSGQHSLAGSVLFTRSITKEEETSYE